MERLSGPSTVALATSAEVRAFVARAPVVALGVFDDSKRATTKLAREYEGAARRLAGDGRGGDIVVFGRVADPGLLPDTILQGERVSGAVYVLKGFDEGVVRFAGEPTAAALSRFIEGHSLPLVAELDRRPESRAILRRVFEHRAPKVIAFVDRDMEEGRQRENIVTALREVAASGETEFRFVVGEASETPLRCSTSTSPPIFSPRSCFTTRRRTRNTFCTRQSLRISRVGSQSTIEAF